MLKRGSKGMSVCIHGQSFVEMGNRLETIYPTSRSCSTCQMEADCANVRTDVQTDHSFRDPLVEEGVQRIVIRPKCDDLSVQKEVRVQQQLIPPTVAKPAE